MNFLIRHLKNKDDETREYMEEKKDFLSALNSIIKFPVRKKDDIEGFFEEVVNTIHSSIEAKKISLNLHGNIKPDYNTHIGEKTIYVPLSLDDDHSTFIGYIRLQKGKDQDIETEEIKFLETLASVTALKFQSSILQLVIYEGLVQTLKVLVNTVEAKDAYTKYHSSRVAYYSVETAEIMGLAKEEKDIIKIAGMLHDIGKIAIPESVLLKESKLTDEEFEIIKMHPIFGDEILKPLKLFNQERMIVRYHHERWDGSGYPEGLKGEDIPIAARILAVSDSFDAMTSDRVYRKARPFENALKEIKELANIKYDPYVVKAFEHFIKREHLR